MSCARIVPLQRRSTINETIVAEYVGALKAGAKFPPVTVFHDGAEHWLSDGFHRFHAHRHAGLDSIAAEIRAGTQRDAVLFSVGANAAHGLRRSNEDKRKAILVLLNDPEWGRWSDREIARRCSVHHETVAAVRVSLAKSPVTTGDPESNSGGGRAYTTKHGTPATMDTSGVAKSNQRRKNNSSAKEGSAKQDSREEASEPAGPVATPAARKKKGGDEPGEVESLRAQFAEALDNAEVCGVSHPFVSAVRSSLETVSSENSSKRVYTRKKSAKKAAYLGNSPDSAKPHLEEVPDGKPSGRTVSRGGATYQQDTSGVSDAERSAEGARPAKPKSAPQKPADLSEVESLRLFHAEWKRHISGPVTKYPPDGGAA